MTGDRLRMEPSILRVIILRRALVAHFKCRHRGIFTVVWRSLDNGEARAAVCAVRERVLVRTWGVTYIYRSRHLILRLRITLLHA